MDQTSNNCDHPTDSSQNLIAAIFLGVHLAGLIPHLCVFPATFQLAKKLSAFMLLLTINIMHFFLLLWGVYFSGQYFIGHRIRLTSLDLDAFVFQTAHLNSMALYVFLSFNRAVAIIFPLKYDMAFSIRTAYSIFANYRPALRFSMCLLNLQPYFPPAMITEPDFITSLILTIGIVFLTITTLVPPILYCICVIFMVVGGVKKAIFTSTAISPPPAETMPLTI
ncbi:hypothetical protein niasHT_015025 [Heterodera trifolii]|uniref:G protein-coupled receptor n=1 Tax=Heterodera trifolii TaxID=157864 RepID=A0ABD2L2X7_9BILA